MTFQLSKVCGNFLGLAVIFYSCSVFSQEINSSLVSETSPQASTAAAAWVVKLPEIDTIDYRGMVNLDSAGGTGNAGMLYPAPNLIGFFAAVVTHSVINESAKSSQKTEMQVNADRFLVPYRETLLSFRQSELAKNGLDRTSIKGSRLLGFSEKMTNEWVIEAIPTFFVTPDENAIILDNAIKLSQVGADPSTAFTTVIRVISSPKSDATLSKFWMVESGAKIKEESVDLYAQSLEIALKEFHQKSGDDGIPYKTVRYRQGSVEKMERAKIVSASCNRMLIKTLRGHLMSVPAKAENADPADANKCA